MSRRLRRWIGIAFALWGGIRTISDLLSSIEATKSYAHAAYITLAGAPSSRVLTVAVVVFSIVFLAWEPVKDWWFEKSKEEHRASAGFSTSAAQLRPSPLLPNDPRIYLEVKMAQGAMGKQTPFELTNRGPEVAHRVRIAPIELPTGTAIFPEIDTLPGSGGCEAVLPKIARSSFWRQDIIFHLNKAWDARGELTQEFSVPIIVNYENFGHEKMRTTARLVLYPIKQYLQPRYSDYVRERILEVRDTEFARLREVP